MAAYGQGPYGGGNYSYGVSLGAVEFAASSAATVAASAVLSGAFSVSASSNVVVDALRVAVGAADVVSSSSATVAGQRLADGVANITSSSSLSAAGLRLAIGEMAITNTPQIPNYLAFGNAQLSTAQQQFGSASLLLDGSGDYIRSPTTVPAFENSDYTVELWVRPNSSSSASYIFDHRLTGGVSLRTSSTSLWVGVGGLIAINIANAFPTAQVWYHIAVTRSGNNTRCFINGVQKGSTYTTAYTATAANLFIGAPFSALSTFFNGYIDEFRLSNVARYTSNFTPPTAAFDYDLNTLILLHLDGSNGSTTIQDSIAPPAVIIAGRRVADGDADITSGSSVVADGDRVAFASMSVGSDATLVVGSRVIVNQGLAILADSMMLVDSRSIIDGSFVFLDSSSIIISGNLKWQPDSDTPEDWTLQADAVTAWTPESDTAEDWTTQADTSTNWTPVPQEAVVWN